MDEVRTSNRILRIRRSTRRREVVDGASIVHALGIRVVGKHGELRVELATYRNLQSVVVGISIVDCSSEG